MSAETSPTTPLAGDTAAVLKPGSRLGKYTVVNRIAFGGMAEIYLARVSGIEGFEKYVVLKRILPQFAADPEFERMFLQEARVAAALDHANISHVYDIGRESGAFFFTMEYLHGEDVRSIRRHLRETKKTLPLEHALTVVIGAAAGLHFAHEKRGADGESLGIVHRDISPSNLVVTYDGGVKVVDFGIAKMTADPEFSRRYCLKGKLSYMAPEQMERKAVDRRGDIFSLGVVLYELTTHSRLFRSETEVETMRKVMEGEIPRPSERVPGYPAELEAIVLRALERDPARRYQTARALEVALEGFARDQRLRTSSAALAEWMESTFGRKLEPWRQAHVPSQPSNSDASSVKPEPPEPTVRTKVIQNQVGENIWKGEAAELGPVVAPTRKRPVNRRFAVAAGLIVTLGVALAITRVRPAAAPSVPFVREASDASPVVMAETGNVAFVRAGETPAPHAPTATIDPLVTPPLPASAHPPSRLPAVAAASRRAPRSATVRSAVAPQDFSGAFARHQPEIRRCFAAPGLATEFAGELSLRFRVNVDGRVEQVEIAPASAAATPVGTCLLRIARDTQFARQSDPVTFRIPVSVQVQRSGRAER